MLEELRETVDITFAFAHGRWQLTGVDFKHNDRAVAGADLPALLYGASAVPRIRATCSGESLGGSRHNRRSVLFAGKRKDSPETLSLVEN